MGKIRNVTTGLLLCAAWPAAAGTPPVRAEVLLSVGDALAGSTVATLNPVFTDGTGRPGSLVVLGSGARVVWYDGSVVFDSSSVTAPVLTGAESTIGIGDGGRFAYSPSAAGLDAIWTQAGLLLRDGDPIPGQASLFATFNSRPSMLPDGRAVWVGGIASTAGGPTEGRALLRANTVGTPAFEVLLRTGDLVGGFPVGTTGVGFNYQISDDGQRTALLLVLDTGSTTNDNVAVANGAIAAREGSPVGDVAPGENWQNFAGVAINNAGNWLLAGDTSGPTATDAFLAYNGVPVVREGATLGGETLDTPAALRAVSINNLGWAVHAWNTADNVRKVFFAPDAARLDLSLPLVRTGTPLDFDGNGTADATVVDVLGTFTATTGITLGEDGSVYLQVSYTTASGGGESLLRFDVSRLFADGFEPAPAGP